LDARSVCAALVGTGIAAFKFNFRGVGNSEGAYDDGVGNIWYNSDLFKGNYWSNLGLNPTYEIDSLAESVDLYPLSSPP